MMKAQDVANAYFSAFYTGDFETAATLLTEDFAFAGPFVRVGDRAAFLTSAEGLRRIAAGHTLLRQVAAGDTICSLYDVHFTTPAGAFAIPMTEWHTVRDGKLAASTVLFDARRFTEMMEAAKTHA